MSVEELLPEKYRDKASDYVKGTDTMDVWFDSGLFVSYMLNINSSCISYMRLDLYINLLNIHKLQDLHGLLF